MPIYRDYCAKEAQLLSESALSLQTLREIQQVRASVRQGWRGLCVEGRTEQAAITKGLKSMMKEGRLGRGGSSKQRQHTGRPCSGGPPGSALAGQQG